MTTIQTIYTFLNECGLFDAWQDNEGTEQGAITVQMRTFKETDLTSGEMCVLIKQAAGSASRYYSEPVFTIAVLSKVGQDEVIAEAYAKLLYETMFYFDNAVSFGAAYVIDYTRAKLLYNTLLDYAMMMNMDGAAEYAESRLQKIQYAIENVGADSLIISCDPITSVNGAYQMESGRSAYDMEFMLRVDSGHVLG